MLCTARLIYHRAGPPSIISSPGVSTPSISGKRLWRRQTKLLIITTEGFDRSSLVNGENGLSYAKDGRRRQGKGGVEKLGTEKSSLSE